jgi:hypothetical protein
MKKAAIALFSVLALTLIAIGVQGQKLKATATAHSATLNWTQGTVPGNCVPACPVTGNNVYRAASPGAEGTTPYAVLSSPVTTFTDTAVTGGLTYYYMVTAVNSGGESGKSNEASVTIPNAVAPNPPTGLTGVAQ